MHDLSCPYMAWVCCYLFYTQGFVRTSLDKQVYDTHAFLVDKTSLSGCRGKQNYNIMKKRLFYVLISCLALSCTSPEKEAEVIMNQFTSSLNEIGDVTSITAKDLSEKLKTCRENVNKMVSSKRKEFTKPEEKERFDNAISINDNEIYLSLRQELANKNLKSIESAKGKKWINTESQSPSSIFMLDETCISFLNLKNKFNYTLEDGDIMFNNNCDTNPLYFTLDGNELIITNGKGQTSRFREVTFEEILQAKWKNPNTYGGKYDGSGIILKKDGKGVEFDDMWKNITYTIKNKNVTTVWNSGFGNVIKHYAYLSTDKLKFTDFGYVEFYRARETGPDCVTFLFDGKLKSDVKTQTTFSTSDSGGSNWDKILDDYEEFVNKYIKLAKKAQNGDMSAITEYAKILEKAQSLSEKLEKAKSDLTVKQANRYAKISLKMLEAAGDL